jgi:hypothetical protein
MAMRRPTLRAAMHKKMQFLEQKSRRRKYLHPRLKLPNLALQYSRDLELAKWVFRGHHRMRDVRFGSKGRHALAFKRCPLCPINEHQN